MSVTRLMGQTAKRRGFAALVALSVVMGGTVVPLSAANAQDVDDDAQVIPLNDAGYDPSTPNPDLVQRCGLDFSVLIDRSGSIGNTALGQGISAIDGFYDAVVDTGSTTSTAFFNGNASVGVGATPVTSGANLTAIKDSYGSLTSTGFTNWTAGLEESASTFGTAPLPPDVLFVFTDGQPNAVARQNSSRQFPDGDPRAVNPAIAEANDIKGLGTKVFVFAIGAEFTGSGAQLDAIEAISGPDPLADDFSNFLTADYAVVDDFAALAEALEAFAIELCASAVEITKVASSGSNATPQPASGWTFGAAVTIDGGDGTWTTPANGTVNGNPKSGVTDGDGEVLFQWRPAGTFTSDVEITETVQPGFTPSTDLACTITQIGNGAGREVDLPGVVVDDEITWTLLDLSFNERAECVATNNFNYEPALQIEKQVSANGTDFSDADTVGDAVPVEAGQEVTYKVIVTNTGNTLISSLVLTDNKYDVSGCADIQGKSLAPAESVDCTYTGTAIGSGSFENIATVTGTPVDGELDPVEDPAWYTVLPVDLAIQKTSIPTTVVAGGPNFAYEITVTNNGPGTSMGQVFTDEIPAPFDYESVLSGDFVCTEIGGAGSNDLECTSASTLAPGESSTVTLEVSVPASAAADDYENCATVQDSVQDDQNDTDCATTTVERTVDLVLDKTGSTSAVAGGTASYTITVDNLGPSDATEDATVTDQLPAGFTLAADPFDGTTASAECTGAEGDDTFTCAIEAEDLAVADPAVTIQVAVNVDAAATAGTYTNVAVVDSPEDEAPCVAAECTPADVEESNNVDDQVTVVSTIADLSILKEGPVTATAGEDFDYTITVTNEGPSFSTAQLFTDTIPEPFVYEGFVPGVDGFVCSSDAGNVNEVTCTRDGTLAPGASASVVLQVSVPASAAEGDYENCAIVEDLVEEDQNDESCTTTTVEREVDLAIDKVGDDTALAGGPASYTITVENLGPSDALADATVTDQLPAGFTLAEDAFAGSDVTCAGNAGDDTFTCTIPAADLQVADDPVTIEVAVTVDAAATAGTYTNVAVVGSDEDPAPCDPTSALEECFEEDEPVSNNVDDHDTEVGGISGEGVCRNDIPEISWTVTIDDAFAPIPDEIDVQWQSADGTPADGGEATLPVLTAAEAAGEPFGSYVLDNEDGTLTYNGYWLGAAPFPPDPLAGPDWPGWEVDPVSGLWVPVPDDLGATTRPDGKLSLSFNPSTVLELSYPSRADDPDAPCDPQNAELSLVKLVNNDDPPQPADPSYDPAGPSDFELTATNQENAEFSYSGAGGFANEMVAEGAYDLSESSVEGYEQDGPWQCVAGEASLSVVHGVPGLVVDVYVNGDVLLPDFEPGTVTDPLTLPPGTYTVEIRAAGADPSSDPAIGPIPLALAPGVSYTAVAHLDKDGAPTASLFVNDTFPATDGGKLTVRHTAANAEGVEVVANDALSLGTFNNGEQLGVFTLPAGTYSAAIKAGDVTVPPTPADVAVVAGQNTIVYAWGDASDLQLAVQTLPLAAPEVISEDTVEVGLFESATCFVVNDDVAVDLEVDKSDGDVTAIETQELDYTIDVANNSTKYAATGVTVTDVLPEGVEFVSAEGGDAWECTEADGTVTCAFEGVLAPGASAPTITITVVVGTGVESPLVNEVEVTSTEREVRPEDNTDTEETPVEPAEPGLEIVKAVSRGQDFTSDGDFFDRASGTPGESSFYRFEVVNTGNVPVGQIVLTDDQFISTAADAEATNDALTEDDIVNCTVGTDGGNLTTDGQAFTFGEPIPGLVVGVEETAFLFCELPIPADISLAEGELIFNQGFASGTPEGSEEPLDPVDSNVTILALTPGILKFIVDEDGSNPVTFTNKGVQTSETVEYFDLIVDNKTGADRYFTVYDYFDDESTGLTEAQRDAVFDSLVCLNFDDPSVFGGNYPTAADYDAARASGGDILTFGPQDITFVEGQNARAEAGTFYARAHYLGLIENGGGFQITCQVTLPAGEYEFTNIFRMIADLEPPSFEVTDPVNEVDAVALSGVTGLPLAGALTSVVASGLGVTFQDAPDGSIAVTGDVDVAAAAGVTLGEPVEPTPTPTPTPTPSPTPSPTPTPPLAQTGGDLARLGLIAAGLIGAGLLVRRFSRRGQDVIA